MIIQALDDADGFDEGGWFDDAEGGFDETGETNSSNVIKPFVLTKLYYAMIAVKVMRNLFHDLPTASVPKFNKDLLSQVKISSTNSKIDEAFLIKIGEVIVGLFNH